jgi:hypothetical protein
MTKVLIVGGTFDKEGGRPSKLIFRMYDEIIKEPTFETTIFNGGQVADLRNYIFPSVVEYNVVLWFANVPNEEDKLRDVKALNPKTIFITSKRNDDNKYTFAELISRALAIKANLTIEFSKCEDKFNMMLFDPLGNVFYDGFDIVELCNRLIYRTNQLLRFTRVPSIPEVNFSAPEVPEEMDFFEFAHSCADIFHNLIRPAKGTERFLGNMSFRCQNGFPSFRGENGIIYVSRRNVDKSDIRAESFVPTYLDEWNTTKYFGDNKPSVDTPVQLRLYKMFPWANYMIHAHCYVDTKDIPGTKMLYTKSPIPCGALEEVSEIYHILPGSVSVFNENVSDLRLLAINLAGHGCILIAKDIEILKELQKYKDNCFVQRPTPEVV